MGAHQKVFIFVEEKHDYVIDRKGLQYEITHLAQEFIEVQYRRGLPCDRVDGFKLS